MSDKPMEDIQIEVPATASPECRTIHALWLLPRAMGLIDDPGALKRAGDWFKSYCFELSNRHTETS